MLLDAQASSSRVMKNRLANCSKRDQEVTIETKDAGGTGVIAKSPNAQGYTVPVTFSMHVKSEYRFKILNRLTTYLQTIARGQPIRIYASCLVTA